MPLTMLLFHPPFGVWVEPLFPFFCLDNHHFITGFEVFSNFGEGWEDDDLQT